MTKETSRGIGRSADSPSGPGSIVYTVDAAGDEHATLPGNPHELVWHPDADPSTGNVTLDDKPRPMGLHLTQDKFHVQAETFFSVRHEAPAALREWAEQENCPDCTPPLSICPTHAAAVRAQFAGLSSAVSAA